MVRQGTFAEAKHENEMSSLVPQSKGEIDISANAAAAIAEVQAAYVMAMKNPRDIYKARTRMLEACERKRFSEKARYHRVVGKNKYGKDVYADGFSVHFARPAAVMMGNILINAGVLYEDDQIRKVVARAADIETNTAYAKEAIVQKAVERKNPTGREVISQRQNSRGDTTYLVVAYPHEVDLAAAKQTAILIRDCVLLLIPPDILEEVEEKIFQVMSSDFTDDPITARKKLVDSFKKLGVSSKQLADYLKHPIEEMTDAEFVPLRQAYQAIRDGQATWADFIDSDPKEPPEEGTLNMNDVKAGSESEHTPVQEPMKPAAEPEGDGTLFPPEISDAQRKDLLDTATRHLESKGVTTKSRQKAALNDMCKAVGINSIDEIRTRDELGACIEYLADAFPMEE